MLRTQVLDGSETRTYTGLQRINPENAGLLRHDGQVVAVLALSEGEPEVWICDDCENPDRPVNLVLHYYRNEGQPEPAFVSILDPIRDLWVKNLA